jgi:predicted ATPase
MLSSIRVENFKSFRDTTQIDLAPLTFLAGVNSAGKSSIIQALLLLKQTLESGPTLALNPDRGSLLEQSLGHFDEFIYGRRLLDTSLVIDVSFTYRLNDEHAGLYEDLKALLPAPPVDLLKLPLNHHLSITFSWGPVGRSGQSAIRVAELQTRLKLAQEALIGLSIRPVGEDDYQVEPLADSIHSSLAGLNFGQLETAGFSHFLPDPFHLNYAKPGDKPNGLDDIPAATPVLYRNLFASARRDLSENLYYLNSFRRPPERIYTASQGSEERLLPDGSNFASILWTLRKRKVTYVFPDGRQAEAALPEMTLNLLNEVLHLPQKVTVQPVGDRDDVLEVLVETLARFERKPGEPAEPLQVPIGAVGLGYNQILPVIVQGLLTPPGAILVVEQPEIHLHPDVQARLVQFFIGLARSGRTVLIETHSSHMIDQLCLEIVKDRDYQLEEKARIFFIHPADAENDSSRIEPVKVDSYGVIQNYPANFLPDVVQTYEHIVREGFRKRKSQSSQDR